MIESASANRQDETLTFTTVDGLAFASSRGIALSPGLKPTLVEDLGPFLEYLLLANSGTLPKPENAAWLKLNGAAALYEALCNRRRHLWICPNTRRTGLYRSYR